MPRLSHRQRYAAWNRRHRGRYNPGVMVGGSPATVTFPASALVSQARIALTPDPALPWWQWGWVDITEFVRWEQGISILAGRRDQSDRVESTVARLTLDNRDGRFSRKNAFGPYYGFLTRNTPIWLAVNPGTGFSDRFFGYVNEWPKRWDRSATDSTVDIGCGGIMRRLQSSQPIRSPLFYTISGVSEGDYVPHVYVPLEDGGSATQAASGLPNGAPATVTGDVTFASDSELLGSEPLPTLGTGGEISIAIPSYTNENKVVFQLALKVDSEPATTTTYFEVDTPGGDEVKWRLQIVPGSPSVVWWRGFNSAGVAATGTGTVLTGGSAASPSEDDFYGSWWFYNLGVFVDEDDGLVWAHFSFTNDGAFSLFGRGATVSTVLGTASAARLQGGNGCAVGHFAVFTDPAFNLSTDTFANAAAMNAWDGEAAHDRIIRLCREQRIPVICQAAESAALGPQPTGKLIDILRDAENADGGVLYEHGFGFGYQALSERYNRVVRFGLDVAQGHLTEDLEPDDSDLRFRNQWTANREDGSSATVQARNGVAGIELSTSEAVYDAEDTFNVHSDNQLADVAGWRAHCDSLDDDYWPNIGFNLAKHPTLISSWLELGYGERMTVDNVMSQAGVDQLDLIIEGYTERWNSKEWEVLLNASPASVFTVFELDDPVLGRLDSGSSTLSAAVAQGATSITVATTDQADLWTTDPAQFPIEVEIAGIEVEVTAIAGASSPQTFTVTSGTVTKALAAGEEVHIATPVVLAA